MNGRKGCGEKEEMSGGQELWVCGGEKAADSRRQQQQQGTESSKQRAAAAGQERESCYSAYTVSLGCGELPGGGAGTVKNPRNGHLAAIFSSKAALQSHSLPFSFTLISCPSVGGFVLPCNIKTHVHLTPEAIGYEVQRDDDFDGDSKAESTCTKSARICVSR